jgi:hypothetical protein
MNSSVVQYSSARAFGFLCCAVTHQNQISRIEFLSVNWIWSDQDFTRPQPR